MTLQRQVKQGIILDDMTRITVSAENAPETRIFRDAGADEIVLAPQKCAMSALLEADMETITSCAPVSLIMNRLFMPEDLHIPGSVLDALEPGQIDRIYFSDPALVKIAEERGLKEKLVYRPEMLAVSTFDAAWWMSQTIGSVSVSPLLTRDETAEILRKCPGLQVTVHGRLLMSVSGRPLLSAYREDTGTAFETDGRNLFLQEAKREGLMPVYETESGTYIYSDFVQESFTDLGLFQSCGADSFYVERLGSETEEIAEAIRTIRRILDGSDAEKEAEQYRRMFPELPLSEGYYGQKTIR